MSISGGYFVSEDFFSPARFNKKTVTQLSGAEISTLSPTYANQIVVCNASGSGYSVNTAYIRTAANDSWLPLSSGKHTHDTDSDSTGGLLANILMANMKQVYWLNYVNPSVGEFSQDAAAGGSCTNDTSNGRIGLTTGTTSNAYANISKHGVCMSFASPSRFMIKSYATHNTYIFARMGVAMEMANASTDTLRKYGIEACDNTGVARTIDVVSSDGTTRSVTTTTEDISQASARHYRLDQTPGDSVKFYVNGALSATKTSNIPTTSRTAGTYNATAGVKTTNGTSKSLYVYGVSLVGTISDSVWQ
jgi:hypothetical protein